MKDTAARSVYMSIINITIFSRICFIEHLCFSSNKFAFVVTPCNQEQGKATTSCMTSVVCTGKRCRAQRFYLCWTPQALDAVISH